MKVELEKRGLSKSGAKKDLVDRLSKWMLANEPSAAAAAEDVGAESGSTSAQPGPLGSPPNVSLAQNLCDNDIVQEYMRMRQSQFESALTDNDAALQRQEGLKQLELEKQRQAEEAARVRKEELEK